MGYIGNQQTEGYSQVPPKQDLTGATGTSLTLTDAVASAEGIDLFINNVRQEPTMAYSVGGDGVTVTLTGSVVATDDIYVVYNSLARQTSTHPSNQALQATSGTFSGTVTANAFSGNGSSLTGVGVAGISSSSTSGTAVSIDANNIVTMPYHPSFAATRGSGSVSNAVYVYPTVYHNIGNHYNSSNGRFTAPVTGSYFISTNHMSENNNTYNNMQYQIRVNSSVVQNVYSSNGGGVHHRWNWSGVILLTAGDYVDVFVSSGFQLYGQSNPYTHFSGHLIG
jgi:hypothetical protein